MVKTKEECDKFIVEYLKTLKDKFADEESYHGRIVRLEIDRMIKRMEYVSKKR